jgi:hypothetical protein
MARDFLRVQLALHHDLGGDAGVVGAGIQAVLWPSMRW